MGSKQYHNYAYEVMEKHKTYTGIKQALKERNIRFHMPLLPDSHPLEHWSTDLQGHRGHGERVESTGH